MAFEYQERTRRQLADRVAVIIKADPTKSNELAANVQANTPFRSVKLALDELGNLGYELVSVVELKDAGSELLYTFKLTV